MKMSTTDGKEYELIDQCPYCQLNIAGNHQLTCPLFNKVPDNIKVLTRISVHIYNKLDREVETIKKIIQTISPEIMVYELDEDRAPE